MSLYELIRNRVLLIAEIGNNHNGDVCQAKALIDAAAAAGADAVKFQTFRGADIVAPNVRSDEYSGWDASGYEFWADFIDSIALPFEAHSEVFSYAREKGVVPFSTPTSTAAVSLLEDLQVPYYKVASMDVTNVPLLRTIASTGKPVILSTGMSSMDEIQAAASIFNKTELVLLHCVSDYPAAPDQLNLRTIPYLREHLKVEVGLSDHSMTNDACIAAVALGARVIEKHFTLSRDTNAVAEHHISLEPCEYQDLVTRVRGIERALGDYNVRRTSSEEMNRSKYRRSLRVSKDLPKGKVLEASDIAVLRPGDGIPPTQIDYVVGRVLKRARRAWEPLEPGDV